MMIVCVFDGYDFFTTQNTISIRPIDENQLFNVVIESSLFCHFVTKCSTSAIPCPVFLEKKENKARRMSYNFSRNTACDWNWLAQIV